MNKISIRCPKCGQEARRVKTRYGTRNSHCDLWSWDNAPLVDAETHEARKAAHAAFDQLWKSGRVKRGTAYKMLAEELGLSRADCHMKIMDAATAKRVLAAVPKLEALT